MPDDTGRLEMLARLDAGRRIGIAIRQEQSAKLIRAVLQVAADDAGTIGIRALWTIDIGIRHVESLRRQRGDLLWVHMPRKEIR